MKKIFRINLLVLLCCTSGLSQIVSGEYFWDSDPGIDLGTPIPASVFVGVTDDTYSFSPPTTGISQGSHRLYFRFKDNAGELSQTISQFVYIGESGIPTITDEEVGLLEYYWDDNSSSPTQITLVNPPVNGNYTFDAPSTGLIVGLHHISIRVKDKYGLWSGFNKVPIFIYGTTPLPNIQTIEYYVDTDAGEGLNTSVSFTPAMSNDVTSNFEIPTTGLSNGQHVATVRVQDTDGTWSGKFSKAFNLDPQFSLTAGALAGQYYCLGGSIEVPITRTGTWPSENEYRLELSDNTGNNFVSIPTTTSFGGSGDKLIGIIPNGLTIGSGYKIRAVTTLPYIRRESSTVLTIGITATASVNSPICANETLSFTSTSTTPAMYSWAGPSALGAVQNPTLSNAQTISTGIYTVTATNVGGCSATATTLATVNPNPTPNTGVDKVICDGSSTTIGSAPIGGNTYAWTPASGLSSASVANPTANPTATTTYLLTVTNTATGCSATDEVTVTVNPNPSPNAGVDKVICDGSSTTIGSPAVSGNTYAWTPTTGLSSASVANPTASPIATTTYLVTLTTTATGCTATDNVVVTVNPNPTLNAGVDKVICDGSSTSIGVAAVAGNTYAWTPASGLSSASVANPTASPTATTTYLVTITTTATGCTATDNVVVTVNPNPTLNAGVDKVICDGSSTTIGSAPIGGNTYAWTPASGLSSASVANPTANPTATTTYLLTVTNTATGCSATDEVTVTVNPNPSPNAGVDKVICDESSTSIGVAAVAGNTYAWSPASGLSSVSAANPTANPSATTTYQLTMTTTATGCSATYNVVVTVNPNPIPNAGVDKVICDGSSTSIGVAAVAGNTYSWTPVSGLSSASVANPTASPSVTSTYQVTMKTTSTGCSASDEVIVTVNPKASLVTNAQVIELPTPGSVDLTLATVTQGSSLPIGTVLGYYTNSAATNLLSNPSNVTVAATYFIKATTLAGCTTIIPVLVSENDSGCLGNTSFISPTNDVSMGITTKLSSDAINAANEVSGTANYTLDAKNAVTLNPGFSTVGTSVVFLAKIGGCN